MATTGDDFDLNILSPELIDQIPLIIIGLAPEGRILHWNRQARKVTGYTKREAEKRGMPLLLHLFLQEALTVTASAGKRGRMEAVLAGKTRMRDTETSILSSSGDVRHVRWNSYHLKKGAGKARSAVIVTGMDMTFRKVLQKNIQAKDRYIKTTTKRLKKYFTLDPHTGLINYRHFMHSLTDVFYGSIERNDPAALIMIDLNYFCSINSIHGVSKGNQILRELGQLLKKNVDKRFLVARFSGTEFAVLMPGTDIKTGFSVAGQLFSLITDYDFGFRASSVAINLSLRMALGGYPHCEDVCTPEQLLDRVIDKLAEAKMTGANSILICSPNDMLDRAASGKGNMPENGMDYKYTVEFVNALANTVKMRDLYTREHSFIMSEYACHMADYLGMRGGDLENVRFGAILHDLGKISIDKMILLKPRSLTKGEFETIKQHPRIGAEIIRNVHPLKDVVSLVLYHHERYDGGGYLSGLRGEEIPLGARIISLADVFQALTSNRPYRKALPEKEAMDIIRGYSGTYFDPTIVKAFSAVYAPRK